jgi:hypothetical protein
LHIELNHVMRYMGVDLGGGGGLDGLSWEGYVTSCDRMSNRMKTLATGHSK